MLASTICDIVGSVLKNKMQRFPRRLVGIPEDLETEGRASELLVAALEWTTVRKDLDKGMLL